MWNSRLKTARYLTLLCNPVMVMMSSTKTNWICTRIIRWAEMMNSRFVVFLKKPEVLDSISRVILNCHDWLLFCTTSVLIAVWFMEGSVIKVVVLTVFRVDALSLVLRETGRKFSSVSKGQECNQRWNVLEEAPVLQIVDTIGTSIVWCVLEMLTSFGLAWPKVGFCFSIEVINYHLR